MRAVRFLAIGLVSSAVLGCSYSPVLQSIPANDHHKGMVYALPKAQVQLDAIRKVVSAQDVDDAKKANVTAGELLTAAEKAVVDAKSVLAKAQSNVDALSDTDPAATREKLASELALATIQLRARTAEAELAKIRADEAGKRLAEVTGNQGKMEQSVVLKPLPPVPDHLHRYTINHVPSKVRDDVVKLAVTNGMLASSVSESTGQAGALLVNLVSSVAGVKSPARSMAFNVQSPAATCKPFTLSRTFDPTDMEELREMAAVLAAESQDALQLLFGGRDASAIATPLPGPASVMGSAGPSMRTPVQVANGATVAEGTSSKVLDGLAYRAPRLVNVEVKAKDSTECLAVTKPAYASLSATVPDSSSLYILPVNGGAFTKSKVEYAFKDGMPITFYFDRPNQWVAAARVPVDMLKAAVEVPASILKLRVDYDSTANALTKADVDSLKAQLDLFNAQRALDAARLPD